jgi:hypothetical protein
MVKLLNVPNTDAETSAGVRISVCCVKPTVKPFPSKEQFVVVVETSISMVRSKFRATLIRVLNNALLYAAICPSLIKV